ncbi:MAG: glycosyltransferase [Ruminococcus sp.]
MRILFAGGGTAGHINPALAIAGYVKKQMPEAEILFVGNKVVWKKDLFHRQALTLSKLLLVALREVLILRLLVTMLKQ